MMMENLSELLGRLAVELVVWLAKKFTDWLWKAYRVPRVLGMAILGFSGSGVGLIIASYFVTGWWQIALLGFGTSLLIVGTVELGIIGVLQKIVEPNDRAPEMIRVLNEWLNQRGAAQRPEYQRSGMEPAEVAAALRALASNLDIGTAGKMDETAR